MMADILRSCCPCEEKTYIYKIFKTEVHKCFKQRKDPHNVKSMEMLTIV